MEGVCSKGGGEQICGGGKHNLVRVGAWLTYNSVQHAWCVLKPARPPSQKKKSNSITNINPTGRRIAVTVLLKHIPFLQCIGIYSLPVDARAVLCDQPRLFREARRVVDFALKDNEVLIQAVS
jgi:hypothetical protein